MRVCQIGCGNHATNVYLEALRRCRDEQDLTLLACCDTDAPRAEAYRAAAGFQRCYGDFRSMLREERPDAVLIVTPFTVTPQIATHVLREGIPCLIEKPPAQTLAEVEALVAVARETGAWHQVAYNRRHMPLIRALREELRGDTVQSIEYRMHRTGRKETHFHTTAVHGFDLVSYLAGGRLIRMRAQYQPLDAPGVINARFLCEYEGGACATLDFLPMSAWVIEQVGVVGQKAYFEADLPVWGARAEGGSLVRYEENTIRARRGDADFPDGAAMYASNGFYEQLRVFFEEAGGKTPSPHTLDTALNAAILEECMRTLQTGYERK